MVGGLAGGTLKCELRGHDSLPHRGQGPSTQGCAPPSFIPVLMPSWSRGSHCGTKMLSRELELIYSKTLEKRNQERKGKKPHPQSQLSLGPTSPLLPPATRLPLPSLPHPGPPRDPHPGRWAAVRADPRPLSCPSSPRPRAPRRPGAGGKTGSAPQHAAAEMRQAGWSGGEDGGRKRTGYLELTANSWAYLCAAEAQESLQNSAQLERGPRLGTRPRPQRHPWYPARRRDAGGREGTRTRCGGWHLRTISGHRRDLTSRCRVGMPAPGLSGFQVACPILQQEFGDEGTPQHP